MGGPYLGFCGGRVDDEDGAKSLILGPSDIQEELTPCVSVGQQGRCLSPLGPTTVGLIYVNPEGPVGSEGDTLASGLDIRNAFSRMGFDDRESVSLIGGGHAFGKAHGACPGTEAPCGEGELQGKGPNTLTSGFEGAWTATPFTWSNTFFQNMFDLTWELGQSPAGNLQWFPAGNNTDDIMMLTSDLALRDDPDYRVISEEYKNDIASLEADFAKSWYRLTSADMGPRSRCIGNDVPPAQAFQNSLPEPTAASLEVDYDAMYTAISDMISEDKATHIPSFSKLAYQCASTFRETDYQGGCNGARIRMEPELTWPGNEGVADSLAALQPIQDKFPDASMADIIVLAGNVAIDLAAGEEKMLPFCPGRVDAPDGDGSAAYLAPRIYNPMLLTVRDYMQVAGLTPEEGVAVMARPGTGDMNISNQFFIDLKANPSEFNPMEQALLEPEFMDIVTMYAADNEKFMMNFMKGWTYLMTADRFDGPVKNQCKNVNYWDGDMPSMPGSTTSEDDGSTSTDSAVSSKLSLSVIAAAFVAAAGLAM